MKLEGSESPPSGRILDKSMSSEGLLEIPRLAEDSGSDRNNPKRSAVLRTIASFNEENDDRSPNAGERHTKEHIALCLYVRPICLIFFT